MSEQGPDFRQMQELEEERMEHNLQALKRIERAGLPDVARDLAGELGLTKEFNQQHERRVANA